MTAMPMPRTIAAIIALLAPCLAYLAVLSMTERWLIGDTPSAGKEQRAALALRDNVTPFQKWGSRQFTWPYLQKHYDAAWYFTQSNSNDCKMEFQSSLATALAQFSHVDLYLLAHDNQFVRWVAELPAHRRARLRLVYNTGCRDLQQGPMWLNLGAKAYVGHPGVSASPVFYFHFLRRWTRGVILQDAIDESNALMRSTLSRVELLSFGAVDAASLSQESEAFCHGDIRLRFAGP